MSRMAWTLRSTRSASEFQSSRSITLSNAPTWNQSSTSTERPLTIAAPCSAGIGCVTAFKRNPSSGRPALTHLAFDPLDQHGQRVADRALLLGALSLQRRVAVPARGDVR